MLTNLARQASLHLQHEFQVPGFWTELMHVFVSDVLALQGSDSELSSLRRLPTAPSMPKLTLMELIEDMKSKDADGELLPQLWTCTYLQ